MPHQKHLLLFVPNYDHSNSSGSGAPLTYLRLGSTTSDSEALTTAELRGDDLLTLVGLTDTTTTFFQDDTRASQDGSGILPSEANAIDGGTAVTSANTNYYKHDGTVATPSALATTGAGGPREQLTGELLSRGGWRDHTDGNRIVTVRGDRVDVVMGNYKRIILGRVAETPNYESDEAATGYADADLKASSWEVSGGHIFEKTSTGVAALKSIEWVQEPTIAPGHGTGWKVLETTAKGDTVTRYSGRIEEHFNGPWQKTTIGLDPSVSANASSLDMANPEVIDEAWVGAQDSKTWADEVVETTTVDTLIEIDDSRNATLNTTVIAPIYDTTTGTPSQYIETFNEELWTGGQVNLELYGFALGFEAATQVYGGAGNKISMSFGTSWEFSFGADITFYLGMKLGIRFGPSLSIDVAVSVEINAGLESKFDLKKDSWKVEEKNVDIAGFDTTVNDVTFSGVKRSLLGFKNKS
jgi:hypothetical protein